MTRCNAFMCSAILSECTSIATLINLRPHSFFTGKAACRCAGQLPRRLHLPDGCLRYRVPGSICFGLPKFSKGQDFVAANFGSHSLIARPQSQSRCAALVKPYSSMASRVPDLTNIYMTSGVDIPVDSRDWGWLASEQDAVHLGGAAAVHLRGMIWASL